MFTTVFYDLLEKNVTFNGNKIAVYDSEDSYTYLQLYDKSEELASWMFSRGVRRGDRVGVHLQKSIDEIVAMFAAAKLGAIFVNINFQWTINQLLYVINDCQISIAIMDERRANELNSQTFPDFLHTILVKGSSPDTNNFFSLDSISSRSLSDPLPVIDNDLAAILYTSGSTGKPKGVMLTHLNIIQGARSVGKYLKNTPTDLIISILPFSFDYGLSQLTTMFLVGGSIFLQRIMLPSEIINSICKYNITGLAAVPPTWVSIVRYLLEVPTELPSLRYITNTGGKIPDIILDSFRTVFKDIDIFLMYGLTESFRSTYLPPEMFDSKKGSIGQSIPNAETFIISPKNTICGPGEEGELVHRGSLVSRGYWGKKDATNAKIKPCKALQEIIGDEKVVYSGDNVRIDNDGYYWFIGRNDSLIKSTGFRISPQEVEEIILKFADISEVVAYGKYDEVLGQAVNIIISTTNNKKIDEQKLIQFCRKNMPHYMIPKQINFFIGQMPRTGSGKIDVPNIIKHFEKT